MNVLILTPDAVGSTLLQRTLTIQMILSDFDKPVINLHELSNGIFSYYNYELQRMVLGKKIASKSTSIGYHQSLSKVVELLDNADHYKTSRLAHYHILNRNDSIEDQLYFYNYLNENFFIIAAKRRNLLDYGLSWVLRTVHKKLNVYTPEEKISSFYEMYKDPITIDTEVLLNFLNNYKNYIGWIDNFDVGSNYYYEDHVGKLEDYILTLPIFSGREKKKWVDAFNLTFQDYNICHRSLSDIGSIALNNYNDIKLLAYDNLDQEKSLTDIVVSRLPESKRLFVEKNKQDYDKISSSINHMVNLGLLVGGLPIKKHTFEEKKYLIKNFNECVNVYNLWIEKNPTLGNVMDDNKLQLSLDSDNSIWLTKEQLAQLPNH